MKLKTLALLFLTSLCGAEGKYQSNYYFQNNGGKLDHISPLLVPIKNAGDLENVTLDYRGQLWRRNPYTVVVSTFALGRSTWVVTGAIYHKAATGANFYAVVVGSDVYRLNATFTGYTKATNTGFNATTITVDTSNLAQATNLNDQAIFCNELDKPFYVGSSGQASVISTNTFSAAKTCAGFSTYLVIGNTTESDGAHPSRVRWSDPLLINSFPALNYIDVEPDDGDSIISMVQYEDSIYVFKHNSVYRMLITGASGADAFLIRPVARHVGCWAKNSLKVIPGVGIVFLGQNTVYTLNGSYASQYSENGLTPIGDPIQRSLENINRTQWKNAVGEVYPKRSQYWLAVSTNGTTNGQVLVYDWIQKAWTVYDGMTIASMATAESSSGDLVLLTGGSDATVYEQDQLGTQDYPGNVATNINMSYTTPDYHMDSPDYTKGFKFLYLYTNIDSTTTITINAAYDLNPTYEFTQNFVIGRAVPVYDSAVYDTDVYPGVAYNISRLELNREARTIRLQFVSSSQAQTIGNIGWTVVWQPEDYKQ